MFAIPFFGRRRLVEIEPRDVKEFAAHVSTSDLKPKQTPRSPATVRQALAPVRALFATAVEEGLIRSNPAAGLRVAAATSTTDDAEDEPDKAKALTEDELHLLLAKTDAAWRPFVEFVAATGMRISEAIAIRWSDVDFGATRVNVKRRWRNGSYGPPKSRYGRRSIPLTQRMSRDLWERRKQAGNPKVAALVWPSAVGKPLDPGNLTARVLKPAATAAGVPWAGWHTLRHTCGTILSRHGANAKQVQHWLGHHSPAFTLAVYVHLLPEDAPDPEFFEAELKRGEGLEPGRTGEADAREFGGD